MFKIRQTGYSILYALSCSFIVEVIHQMEQVKDNIQEKHCAPSKATNDALK